MKAAPLAMLMFPLHDLGRRRSPDRRLDERIDIGDVDAVARDLRAVDRDGECGLAKLPDQGELGDPAHPSHDLFDGLSAILEGSEVGAEDLHVERALEASLRLVDGVFRGLREVEGDSRESLELPLDRRDQLRLGVIWPRPLPVRLEADVELRVEEARRVRAVVRPSVLVRDDGHGREGAQDAPDLGNEARRFLERDRVWHGCADPQRALVQLRHEFGAEAEPEEDRKGEETR
jgi:hypothetical protein